MAINRLELLERKFHKNSHFAKLYRDQSEEYIAFGQAHQLSMEG